MYKRALTRRNTFKYYETFYNSKYEVKKKSYDFLIAASKSEATRDIIRRHWQGKITEERSKISFDPYKLKDLQKLSTISLSVIEKEE